MNNSHLEFDKGHDSPVVWKGTLKMMARQEPTLVAIRDRLLLKGGGQYVAVSP